MQLPYLPGLLSASGSADMPQLVVSRAIVARGWGASLFPLPFLQAWSQPGIKLFKSSRWALQLNFCAERTGCEIPRAPALLGEPPAQHKAHWAILVLPCLAGVSGLGIESSHTSSPSTAVQGCC